MENDKNDFKKFAMFKGLIEAIDFILLFIIMGKDDTAIFLLSLIPVILLTIVPNLKYKLNSIKDYWKANLKAILYYFLFSVILIIIVSTFGSEYEIFAVIFIPFIFNFFYIPAFLVVSFIVDTIYFKINNNK